MSAPARRVPVSPYARRLARERALPLETMRGSGPGGRILATDVHAFVPTAAIQPPQALAPAASPSIGSPRIAAFAATVSLGATRELIAMLEQAGHPFAVEDLLLCTAGRVFAETGDAAVALELTGRQAVFAGLAGMSPASVRAMRLATLASTSGDTQFAAALSLRFLDQSGIRPLAIPLLPGRAMRLTITLDSAAAHAECLLTVDVAQVDEAAAADWLARFRTTIENPLRLFV